MVDFRLASVQNDNLLIERKEAIDIFKTQINQICKNAKDVYFDDEVTQPHVLYYYGLPNLGKTKLIQSIKERIKKSNNALNNRSIGEYVKRISSISLFIDYSDENAELGTISSIINGISATGINVINEFPITLWSYALLATYDEGRGNKGIYHDFSVEDGAFSRYLKMGKTVIAQQGFSYLWGNYIQPFLPSVVNILSMAGITIAKSFFSSKTKDKENDTYKIFRKAAERNGYGDVVDAILEPSSYDYVIKNFLTRYFYDEIESFLKKNNPYVFFCDTAYSSPERIGHSNYIAEYLVEIVRHSPYALWVFTGREKIDEKDETSRWERIKPIVYEIRPFSKAEEIQYLSNAAFNRAYKKDVALLSEGNPYLLSVLCNYFQNKDSSETEKNISEEDKLEIRKVIIKQYIQVHDVIKDSSFFLFLVYLSNGWTDEFISRFAKVIPGFSEENFRYINNLAIVRIEGGKHIIHESIREPLARYLTEEEKARVINLVCDYLNEAVATHNNSEIDDAIKQITQWGVFRCGDIFVDKIEWYIRQLIVSEKREKARIIIEACENDSIHLTMNMGEKRFLIFRFWLDYSWYFYYLFCGYWKKARDYEKRCNNILDKECVSEIIKKQLAEKRLSTPSFLSSEWTTSLNGLRYGMLFDRFICSSDYEWNEAFDLYKEAQINFENSSSVNYCMKFREAEGKALSLNNDKESVFSILCYLRIFGIEASDLSETECSRVIEKIKNNRDKLLALVGEDSIVVMEPFFIVARGVLGNIASDFPNAGGIKKEVIEIFKHLYVFFLDTFGFNDHLTLACLECLSWDEDCGKEAYELSELAETNNCCRDEYINALLASPLLTDESKRLLGKNDDDSYFELDYEEENVENEWELPASLDEQINLVAWRFASQLKKKYSGEKDCSGNFGYFNRQDLEDEIIIPDGVKSIGNYAFSKSNVKRVRIPESVEIIKKNAFCDCLELTEIRIPGGVKVIESGAFSNCTKLRTVQLDDGIIEIKDAFNNCRNLYHLDIPGSVKKVSGFNGCSCLKNLYLENGIEEICVAFSNATSLCSVAIPDSVRIVTASFCKNSKLYTVGLSEGLQKIHGSFNDCISLREINFPDSLVSINGFNNCKMLKQLSISENISDLSGFNKCDGLVTLTIPHSVKQLSGFCKCSNLMIVNLEDGIEKINMGFNDCPRLTEIYIPATVFSLSGLNNCRLLSDSVELPPNLDWLGPVFNDCPFISTITIPPNVTHGYEVFSMFSGTVVFSQGMKTIPEMILKDAKMVKAVVIPNSIEEIGVEAFSDCINVERLTIPSCFKKADVKCSSFMSSGEKHIGSFSGYHGKVIFSHGLKSVPANAFRYSSVCEVELPDTVKSIEEFAFADFSTLKDLCLPPSVVEIRANAFKNCDGLESIVIPSSVLIIRKESFSGCRHLKSVLLLGAVTVIEEYAFKDCESLSCLVIPDSVKRIERGAFSGCHSLSCLEIPSGIVSLGTFSERKELLGGAFEGYDGKVLLKEGIERIIPSDFKGSDISSVEIPDSVKGIDDYGFSGCRNLKEIIIPNSVEYIGRGAFSQCENLEKVTISTSIKEIGNGLFFGCRKLTEIVNLCEIRKITKIGVGAFKDCEKLTEIRIQGFLDSIGEGAFDNCYNLSCIELPSSLKKIPGFAFRNCRNLGFFCLPTSLEYIGNKAFSGCSKLSIALGNKIKQIGSYAFEMCDGMQWIEIPGSVKKIGVDAFSLCSNLQTISIKYSENELFDYPSVRETQLHCFDDGKYEMEFCDGSDDIKWDEYQIEHEVYKKTENKKFSNASLDDTLILPEIDLAILVDSSCMVNEKNLYTSQYQIKGIFGDYSGKVKIEEGVVAIGHNLFAGGMKITELQIPSSVKRMGSKIIDGCHNLLDIVYCGTRKEWCLIDKEEDWNVGTESFVIYCSDGTMMKGDDEEYFEEWDSESLNISDFTDTVYEEQYSFLKSKAVVIPESVKTIERRAFFHSRGVKTIIIPSSVDELGEAAFANSTDLTSIFFKGPLSKFNKGLFQDCSNLTHIEIPKGLNVIDDRTFCGCTSLISLTIPDSVKRIGNEVFLNCSSLTSIEFSNGLIEIGNRAFCGCTSLKAVFLPDSVDEMGEAVFSGCVNLETVSLPVKMKSINHKMFEECEALKEVTVSSSVTRMGGKVFSGCEGLRQITIPPSVVKFGDVVEGTGFFEGAFEGYSGKLIFANGWEEIPSGVVEGSDIHEVEIPFSVKKICRQAFAGCRLLETVVIPDSVEQIGQCSFKDCKNLRMIKLPNVLKRIENDSFSDCASLIDIVIPNSASKIGEHAFAGCLSLERISLPDTIEEIESSTFEGCRNLACIQIPKSVRRIDDEVFAHCSSLKQVVIPETVEFLGNKVFKDCSSLELVQLPNSLCSLSPYLFEDCLNLSSIEIPPRGTSIEESVFKNCQSLSSITVPAGVKCIGAHAFEGCTSLTDILIPEGVERIGVCAFFGCNNLKEIRIPLSVNTFDSCNEHSKEGKLDSFVGVFSGYAGRIVFHERIKKIPDSAFAAARNIKEVDIPNGTREIGDFVFAGCTELKEIRIPEGVLKIGGSVFSGCATMSEVIIPSSVKEFGSYFGSSTFRNFAGKVTFATGCEEIPKYALYEATKVKAVSIPQGVKIIGESAFQGCDSLKTVTFPSSVRQIGESAFASCTQLETVNISEGMERIDGHAFYDCKNLKNIYLPETVLSLGGAVFQNCINLEQIYIPRSVKEFGSKIGRFEFYGAFYGYYGKIYTFGDLNCEEWCLWADGSCSIEDYRCDEAYPSDEDYYGEQNKGEYSE